MEFIKIYSKQFKKLNFNFLLKHAFLFSFTFIFIILNKYGRITSQIILEITIAQVLISTFSSIYLFRYPDKKKSIKIGYESLMIFIVLFLYLKYFKNTDQLNLVNIFIFSIIYIIKDLLRIVEINFKKTHLLNFLISIIISVYLITEFPLIVFYIVSPIIFLFPFINLIHFKFIKIFNLKNIGYFIEDIPVITVGYLLTIDSFSHLDKNQFADYRIHIAFTSFSSFVQYFMFQYYYNYNKEKLNMIKINIILFPIIFLLYFLFGFKIMTVCIIVSSSIFYFYLKSLVRANYLFFVNLINLVITYILLDYFNFSYFSYYFVLITSSFLVFITAQIQYITNKR